MPARPRSAALLLAALLGCSAEKPPLPSPPPPAAPAPAPPSVAAIEACTAQEMGDAGAPEAQDDRFAKARPENAADLCANADSNLERAAAAILAAPRLPPSSAAVKPWDHKQKPARLGDVARRFALGQAEVSALEKNGFVVPARFAFDSYAAAFHEIYQSEMPLYVSADAVLHAVFRGNDAILARLEQRRLSPLLARTLAAMSCALPDAAAGYPEETANDLDLYLTVARSLLADQPVAPVFPGTAAAAAVLVQKAKAAEGLLEVEMFGRARRIDFTAFTPRGHYPDQDKDLAPYFRAAMWLSRVELNLVSRSSRSSAATQTADPRETPREAVDALALADLATRAGVNEGVRAMDRAWATFGGKREDVSLDQLAELRAQAAIGPLTDPATFDRLKEAIGDRYQRTARLHYMPQGTTVLPAITTFLGPRVVAETVAVMPLVEPQIPDRHVIGAADMAYALGQDRARAYLREEEARFPQLGARLAEARALAHAPPTGEDLHGLWLQAVLALGDRPAGALPSFMGTDAFADLRLSSTIVAFGQLRHNAVLFAGQSYDQGGCEIPDGYVEPAPAVYQALAAYADRGAAAAGAIDPGDDSRARAYFQGLARNLRVLDAIAAGELAGRALSEEERRWLSMILEMTPSSSSGGPTYTGWYFDLFPSRREALARADFIADYHTSGFEGVISYAGARSPRIGFFVVDTGGAPRVVAGPVTRGYEHHGPLARRLDDNTAAELSKVSDPWEASYSLPAPPPPDLMLHFDDDEHVTITAPRAIGSITVEVLDHHRKPIDSITRAVQKGTTVLKLKKSDEKRPVEALHLHAGAFDAWTETGSAESPTLDYRRGEAAGK